MKDVFAFIGMIGTLATLFAFCGMFLIFIYEKIVMSIRRYKYKHRFNKSPTAKCYCKDCKWCNRNNQCDMFSYCKVEDNWFCWRAEPRE